MPDRPAVTTVPNVELMTVGTWDASTGQFHVSIDDLAAAVAAQDDPGYRSPFLKVGHTDPRFDGNPALGRVLNLRLSDDRQTLVGDLVGVPGVLAEALPLAWPSRSVEAQFGLVTQTGGRHRFALTALSLLGAVPPAVSELADVQSISDVMALYGLDPQAIAASAAQALEEQMTSTGSIRAALSMDSVRNAFYATPALAEKLGAFAWVREVFAGSTVADRYVIADDDNGNLFRIPWSEGEGQSVTFGEPTRVAVEYVESPSAQRVAAAAGALRARLAHLDTPQTPPPTVGTTPNRDSLAPSAPPATPAAGQEGQPMQLSDDLLVALRARLGLAEDADEDAIQAAITAPPATPPAEVEEEPPAPVAASHSGPGVIVDPGVLSDLQAAARRSDEMVRRQSARDRDEAIQSAQADGRISAASAEQWRDHWNRNPQQAALDLNAIPKGLIPVHASGYVGDPDEMDDNLADSKFASLWPPDQRKAL